VPRTSRPRCAISARRRGADARRAAPDARRGPSGRLCGHRRAVGERDPPSVAPVGPVPPMRQYRRHPVRGRWRWRPGWASSAR
jgi:hypothetical protein